ncbi:MAG: sensor histidine kinase, partial [Minwuia sp.]|nr:sensor histidine kinase [Minwuia sp.]
LGNLISNAVKFTPPGGEVVISASSVEDTVELAVEDNGIGIPEEEQERVFETFRTSDRHTRRGAGLGLALVRSLMELMGGSVTLRSESGVGTRVSCRFIALDAEFDEGFEDTPTPVGSGTVVPISGQTGKSET